MSGNDDMGRATDMHGVGFVPRLTPRSDRPTRAQSLGVSRPRPIVFPVLVLGAGVWGVLVM